jgi:hypothetical protein
MHHESELRARRNVELADREPLRDGLPAMVDVGSERSSRRRKATGPPIHLSRDPP